MRKAHDLILIRHEEAEGNVAMVKSKFGGDSSLFTAELRNKPSDAWRLTERGRERCGWIGNWIEKHVLNGLSLQTVTSPSARAKETAGLILPKSTWTTDELVRGRNWGGIECIPWGEWPGFCKVSRHEDLPSGFHQAYPKGEAMAEVWKRTREFINSLEESAIVVTHGEVLLMARILLESVPESEYHQLERNGNHIRNGQVVWYSKRHPSTGELSSEFAFRRMLFDSTDTGWSDITPR